MVHMVIIIRPHLGDGMRELGQAPQRSGAEGVRRRSGGTGALFPAPRAQLPFQGTAASVLLASRPSPGGTGGGVGAGESLPCLISVMHVWGFLCLLRCPPRILLHGSGKRALLQPAAAVDHQDAVLLRRRPLLVSRGRGRPRDVSHQSNW